MTRITKTEFSETVDFKCFYPINVCFITRNIGIDKCKI